MKVLLINTSERIGGAAVACNRLCEALNKHGIDATMLVRDKISTNEHVTELKRGFKLVRHFLWERFVIFLHNHFKKENIFKVDIANISTDITLLPEFQEADIIHLHWINQGMLSLQVIGKILKSKKPVVWTMHDMWPATGICHHARSCQAFHSECHHCQYLYRGGGKRDLSRKVFRRKKKTYAQYPIHFVACSEWLKHEVSASALLQGKDVRVIPNPINTELFKPTDKQAARMALQLPADKKLILFGSVKITDKRKGIDYLIEACNLLAEQHPELKEQIGIVVFGRQSDVLTNRLPFEVYPKNFILDETQLVQLYAAVDVYVTPSLEENLPNTIMEAMACGTPCVGFHVGGIPEMITHNENGYIARYQDAEDLANGILQVLANNCKPFGERAVRKARQSYAEDVVAEQYITLYKQLLTK